MKKVGRYFLLMAAIMTISSCVSTPPKKDSRKHKMTIM